MTHTADRMDLLNSYRVACLIIQQHGVGVKAYAAQGMQKMRAAGDERSGWAWMSVLDAVLALEATKPPTARRRTDLCCLASGANPHILHTPGDAMRAAAACLRRRARALERWVAAPAPAWVGSRCHAPYSRVPTPY